MLCLIDHACVNADNFAYGETLPSPPLPIASSEVLYLTSVSAPGAVSGTHHGAGDVAVEGLAAVAPGHGDDRQGDAVKGGGKMAALVGGVPPP